MRDWKTLCKKLLFPPAWLIIILTVISTIALVAVFINEWELSPIAYVIYVVSFYALTVVCIACWNVFPGYYRVLNGKLHENKYADKYMTDVAFKTHVGLYRSLIINLIYVLVNAISAIFYKTYWFGIFAVYYGIIAVMRFLLVRYVKENPIGKNHLGELKRARLCAGILLLVNLSLSATVLMMVYFDRGFSYQGFLQRLLIW